MPHIFDADMASEAAYGLQSSIALRNGRSERGPIDGCLRMDIHLLALSREDGEALEQVLGIRHRKARDTAQCEIGLDGVQH
ncbi:hypothetical protein [Rhizobium laguerreae]|uniref:hypothetical protein n=1 Tax=Rhizobium laguerreae TaxID=1076926 RepID=UPI0021B107F3|nr:hypothetical protein [Rhizobium laguerreae]